MKRMLCVIAGSCSLLSLAPADEVGMQNVLSAWKVKQTDWESAVKTAETDEKKKELMSHQPDAVGVAREVWKQVANDLRKPYALPAIVWLLEHPQALQQAFPSGNMPRKIIIACLDALEKDLLMQKGVGQAAYALSVSKDFRCRVILEQIKDVNPFPEDQGLAALGLSMIMKENSGMLQDDPRIINARGKLLKDAIIKCYESSFGPLKVEDLVKEELYEIRNLNIGQKGPDINLPSSDTGKNVVIPGVGRLVLLVFWDPRDLRSVKFLEKAGSLRKEFPEMDVMPIAPMSAESVNKALLNLNLKDGMASLVDEQAHAFKNYRVAYTPYVYLLDPEGKILMRGFPDMLFDANLYASIDKFKNKEAKKTVAVPETPAPPLLPERINSPDTRVPVPQAPPVRVAPAPPASAPPLRPMPE